MSVPNCFFQIHWRSKSMLRTVPEIFSSTGMFLVDVAVQFMFRRYLVNGIMTNTQGDYE
jgi:hypothetical protein